MSILENTFQKQRDSIYSSEKDFVLPKKFSNFSEENLDKTDFNISQSLDDFEDDVEVEEHNIFSDDIE